MALADLADKPTTALGWIERLLEKNGFDMQMILQENRLRPKGTVLTSRGRMDALLALRKEKEQLIEQRVALGGKPADPEDKDTGSPPGNPPSGGGGGDGPKETVKV